MAFVYWIHLPEHTDLFSEGYIGYTSNTPAERLKTHVFDSKRERYSHITLYKAFKKYGVENLVVTTLVQGSDEYCLDLEHKLRATPKIGWNTIVGGGLGNLGTKASDETRQKQSLVRTGNLNHFYGRKHSEETKSAISKAKIGKRLSAETLKAVTATRKKFPWNVGVVEKDNWLKAAEIAEGLSQGRSVAQIARDVGANYTTSIRTIVKRLRDGWEPNADPNYLAWQETYVAEIKNEQNTQLV